VCQLGGHQIAELLDNAVDESSLGEVDGSTSAIVHDGDAKGELHSADVGDVPVALQLRLKLSFSSDEEEMEMMSSMCTAKMVTPVGVRR
jgi:hypothetical protein